MSNAIIWTEFGGTSELCCKLSSKTSATSGQLFPSSTTSIIIDGAWFKCACNILVEQVSGMVRSMQWSVQRSCFPCKIMSKVMEHYSVRINGIQSRPELNGQIGKLSGEPTGSGRPRWRRVLWSRIRWRIPQEHPSIINCPWCDWGNPCLVKDRMQNDTIDFDGEQWNLPQPRSYTQVSSTIWSVQTSSGDLTVISSNYLLLFWTCECTFTSCLDFQTRFFDLISDVWS